MEVIVIALVVIIVIAVIALGVIALYQNHSTAIYERRLRAEAEYDSRIMSAARTFQAGGMVYVTRGVNNDGVILYDIHSIGVLKQSAAEVPTIDADIHRLAVLWAIESMKENGKDGNQLLPESRVRGMGLISDPNKWVIVGDYLKQFGVMKVSDRGKQNGTYTNGTIGDLMLALSIRSLPPTQADQSSLAKSA